MEVQGRGSSLQVLAAKDIKKCLKIGNKKLYELFNRKDFPSFLVGGEWRILEDDFTEWMKKQTKSKLKKAQ